MPAKCLNVESAEARLESKEGKGGVVGGKVEAEEITPASASSVPPRFKGFSLCRSEQLAISKWQLAHLKPLQGVSRQLGQSPCCFCAWPVSASTTLPARWHIATPARG